MVKNANSQFTIVIENVCKSPLRIFCVDNTVITVGQFITKGITLLIFIALRYAASDGQWKESAIRLTNSIANIRAIVNHFNPKVESWMTAHNLSSLTEEQVYYSI